MNADILKLKLTDERVAKAQETQNGGQARGKYKGSNEAMAFKVNG